ncbi:MAG: CRISPR-associated protein family [Caloramator sp.]|jgi:CRISPR-associated Csx2 family protein|uniref:TIGR02221 family CRISPR-associated protein n=1 Tax=Caloramator sp. TaxID=1871330 RepID=UPI001D23EA92|nr:TIGR02221 family CRISPR-associated protein [Caloramator sp.]MBZ4663986.1 CRISPR-associated protein family [Caloramator sp.]
MARKFLSFLGTGEYTECTYKCPKGAEVKSRFIQTALVEDLCREWTEDDEVIIFLTNASRNKNWEDSERFVEVSRDEKSPEEIIIRRNKKTFIGLKNELQNKNYKVKIVDKSIPEGKNVDEIWEIFNVMMDCINDDDEVIFDITHSFRSIPMLALVVLNYAKVMKDINMLGIYYGAFEARDKDGVAPVFELKEFDRLLEWSYAINSFVKFGDSRQILDFVNREKKYDEKYREVYNFAKKLNTFTDAINTCKGIVLDNPQKSVYAAYKDMIESLNTIREKQIYPTISELLKLVEKKSKIFDCNDNLSTGMAFVEWCIQNNLIQQGYTALDETIKTFICVLNDLDDSDKDIREEIAAKAMAVYKYKDDESKWIVKEEYKEKVREILKNTPKEIFKVADAISVSRNDINHFGFTDPDKRKDVSKLKSELGLKYNELKEVYDEYLNNKGAMEDLE